MFSMDGKSNNPFGHSTGLINSPPPFTPNPFGLLYRPEVSSLYYNNKTITLDGYTFIGCRFDNCKLEVSSTNFDLINCIIDPSTQITYAPSVLKIIRLFMGRYNWAYTQFPQFVPVINADGTITISDRPA